MRIAAVFVLFCSAYAAEPDAIPYDGTQISPAETQAFLEKICPGHVIAAGCSVCAAQTGFPNNVENWQLRAIVFGHFLSSTSEGALVTGFGCESHAAGLGGGFLFTKDGASWRKVWYGASEAEDHCKKLTAADGRDLLVCEAQDMHQGFADTFLYVMVPGKTEENGLNIFFSVDDSLGSCVSLPDGAVESGSIESVSFHGTRIVVVAQVGKAIVPQKVLEDCGMSNFQRKPIITTVRRRYEFLFDGQNVTPIPGNPPTEAPVTSWSPATRQK